MSAEPASQRVVSHRLSPNRTCAFRYASGSPEDMANAGVFIQPRRNLLIGVHSRIYCSCRPSAVWDSKHGLAADQRKKRSRKDVATSTATDLPDFVAPQLCETRARPPAGDDWLHEIKFDGYRFQMRVADGKATLKTRKGLDWTGKYPEIAEAASGLPDCIIDGEICALDQNGAPDFAALQAALSEGKTGDLVYFAFDLLFDGGDDLRSMRLVERKERLQALLTDASNDPRLRFVEHFESGGRRGVAVRLQAASRGRYLEADGCALSIRPH